VVVCCNGTVELEVTLSGGGRVIRGLQRPATGRSTWIVCGQSLASKCRVEPTVSGWGKSNSRSTASSNGWVEIGGLSGGWGSVGCRFSRHINSSQFSRCPFRGQCLIVQQRDGCYGALRYAKTQYRHCLSKIVPILFLDINSSELPVVM